jgi:hypothetical protein
MLAFGSGCGESSEGGDAPDDAALDATADAADAGDVEPQDSGDGATDTDTADTTPPPDASDALDAADAPDISDAADIADIPDTADVADAVDTDATDLGDCLTDADCDDGNVCTSDTCDGGACAYEFSLCEDSDLCTLDGCDPLSGCVHEGKVCASSGPCEVAACSAATGQCTAAPVDCDDGDPCTDDSCDALTGCSHAPSVGVVCCEEDGDCADPGPCAVATCSAGVCTKTAVAGVGCCEEAVWSESFDGGVAGGFSLGGSGAVGWTVIPPGPKAPSPALYFGDPASGTYDFGTSAGTATSPAVLLPLGVESALSFSARLDVEPAAGFDVLTVEILAPDGLAVPVWTKAVDLEALDAWESYSLDLSGLAGTEIRVRFTFDTVDASWNDGGGVWVDDLAVTSTCAPRPCAAEGDCADRLVQIIGSCEDGACAYAPNAWTCGEPADCDDGDACTEDDCTVGFCDAAPADGCCSGPEDCDDGDVCTMDLCLGGPGGACTWIEALECCAKVFDCDDGNPCTKDACPVPLGLCAHTPVASCCVGHVECDDADPCTEDACLLGACVSLVSCCSGDGDCASEDPCRLGACEGGTCVWTFADSPACCNPVVAHWTFDSSLDGWTPVASEGDVAWHLAASADDPADLVLAYASQDGVTYATGDVSSGAIESPQIVPPLAGRLTFRLWLHNEFSGAASANLGVDEVRLVALPEGADPVVLWTSSASDRAWWAEAADGTLAGPTWTLVGPLLLTELLGAPTVLRFEFDSKDAALNDFGGARIDDVEIQAPCAPP